MHDPFEHFEDNLVNISNGAIQEKTTSSDLLQAHQVGTAHYNRFLQENLLSNDPDLFRPIKKNSLQTFV